MSSVSSNPNFVGKIQTPVAELKSSPVSDAKIDSKITAGAGEAPIDIYEGKTGKPYLVDMMDIAELYGKSDFEDEIRQIDQFVLNAIEVAELTKTKASYQSIVSKLMGKLGIDPNLQYDKKISRLSTYVKVLNDRKEIEIKKKALEHVVARQRREYS